jgi:hypothetical protein
MLLDEDLSNWVGWFFCPVSYAYHIPGLVGMGSVTHGDWGPF